MNRSDEALAGTLPSRAEDHAVSSSDAVTTVPTGVARTGAFGLGPGTIVDGTYRVLGELGRGAMGVVLLAEDLRLQRSVAIKLIRPELLDQGDLRERFLSEARAMARVRHPNVLPIYALGEHEGMPYFISEFVEGQTVEHWLESRSPGTGTDIALAHHILEGTCRGVAAIHAADTVHRDLKPSNLLLGENFRVRVADMGVADMLRQRGRTQGELVGTPEYMAPESASQQKVPPELAHRADVYSLGCIAFELFTGRAPFSGSSGLARMIAHVLCDPPRATAIRPELPAELDDVLFRALAKNPSERTPSADALRRSLTAVRRGMTEPAGILIADDDDDFCELLVSSLRREFPDALVERASDGTGALEAFDQRRPSVVILDLGMPNLGGMQLTKALRERAGSQNIPILVLTGSGGPTEWRRLAALGADGFLVKPVNLKDVVTLVRRSLLDRSQSVPPSVSS
jgi:serine/threonine protein kinase